MKRDDDWSMKCQYTLTHNIYSGKAQSNYNQPNLALYIRSVLAVGNHSFSSVILQHTGRVSSAIKKKTLLVVIQRVESENGVIMPSSLY